MNRTTRVENLYKSELENVQKYTDEMFCKLMVFQWIVSILAAVFISPKTWIGQSSETHIHVWAALFLGSLLCIFPLLLVKFYSSNYTTRCVICISQMIWSALLIHVFGGRIETHFHIFGSLAFIAAYRDYKLLLMSTLVVAVDHFARGLYWPQSVYGIIDASEWRWLEHTGWVIFEDVFLFSIIFRSKGEMTKMAERQVDLEIINHEIEKTVEERTNELKKAYQTLEMSAKQTEKIQSELLQSEKMASIGSLASGIAHEINTPIQYIGDNLQFLFDEQKNIFYALEKCDDETKEKIDLKFLKEEVPGSLKQSLEGLSQVANLVKSMKEFAHPGSEQLKPVNINRAINNVVTVLRSQWKYIADIDLNLDEDLPEIPCLHGEFNQIILNIIVNACHAVEDKKEKSEKGKIKIETEELDENIVIIISDNGTGIPQNIESKIFDLFFTTKEVGKGSGQGLAIAYSLINEKLNGSIKVDSEEGKGTSIIITLPKGPKSL